MRLLLTNDDGVRASGLHAMARALVADGHDLVIAAPSSERSGSSASLGGVAHGSVVAVSTVRLAGLEDVPTVAVDAPPAFAVRGGCLGVLGDPPDLVVSGINPGHNVGRLLVHSGTVGAAMTACTFDVPAVAVSCGADAPLGYATAARVGAAAVRAVAAARPGTVALNVNVPDREHDDIVGVESTVLSGASTTELGITAHADGWQLRRASRTSGFEPGSDSDVVGRGFVSVSALGADLRNSRDVAAVVDTLRREVTDARDRSGPTHAPF